MPRSYQNYEFKYTKFKLFQLVSSIFKEPDLMLEKITANSRFEFVIELARACQY